MKCVWPLLSPNFVTLCNQDAPYMHDGNSLCPKHAQRSFRANGIGEVMPEKSAK